MRDKTRHASHIMAQILALREKYDLHMKAERFAHDGALPEKDMTFIKKENLFPILA